MIISSPQLALLKAPFPVDDVEGRIGQSGMSNGKIWATALAYVTNRAIMERLDEAVGPENWKNEFMRAPEGGVLCGLSIRIEQEWVAKWDGAENTQIEAVKGGLSDSMKRAAVQWGIGRYLYNLPRTMARIADDNDRAAPYRGEVKDGVGKKIPFRWYAPSLPDWALPKESAVVQPETNGRLGVYRERQLKA
jgi:hypothetical protein